MFRLLVVLALVVWLAPCLVDADQMHDWRPLDPLQLGSGVFPGWADAVDLEADGSLSADVVAPAEIADADFGNFTCALGVCTLDNDVVTDEDIDWSDVSFADFDEQTAWRLFYSDGSGDVTELAFGTDGQYLKSQGAALAPIWETPTGTGDITGVWECASAGCDAITAAAGDSLDATAADSVIPWTVASDCSTYTAMGEACLDSDDGLLYVGNALAAVATGNPFGSDIGPTELFAGDFGPFTCDGTNCDIDNDTLVAEDVDFTNFSLVDFTDETAWRVWYSNASGDVTALALGASGEYLQSNGVDVAPTWTTPAGSGDVTGAGDCADGACLDGTSDGGTTFSLYDGDSHAGAFAVTNLSAARTYTFPDATGTVVLSTDFSAAADLDADGGITTGSIIDSDLDFSTIQLADFTGEPAWVVYYSDGSGDVQQLGLGADGEVLTSTGATGAPAWEAAGTGDVAGAGDCTDGDCLDGTSDGGTLIALYDTNSNKTTVLASDTVADVTVYLPTSDGTLISTLTDAIGADEMADEDLGDMTCSGGVCTLDANTVANAEMADNAIGNAEMADNAVGNAEMADDAIGAAEMADGDHGHVSWSGGAATVEDFALNAAADGGDFNIANLGDLAIDSLSADVDNAAFYVGDGADQPIFRNDGTPAADDTYSGVVISSVNCGENVAQWDLVYMDDTANEWMLADANAAGKFPAVGMATAACTDGNPGVILMHGVVRNAGWAATLTGEGKAIYLSETAGGITETQPADAGDAVQHVARVLSDASDTILFNPNTLWVELD